ncbi:MAG: CinA family protein [Ruminococcus sp.]|nr:CinA family protein [Ruminococcus sp.]
MKELTAKQFEAILKTEGINRNELQDLAVNALIEKKQKVATAESCTGGLVSKRITEVGGASAVFECGVCSYANRIKNKLLGVNRHTLDTVGAVSKETAEQMAAGVMKLAGADFGVAATGIAGPSGGTDEKPVGLVYIAVCDKKCTEVVKAKLWDSTPLEREKIREISSDIALYLLLRKIVQKPSNITN